jgi:hypothetical protein
MEQSDPGALVSCTQSLGMAARFRVAAVYLDAAFDFGPGYQRGRRPGRPLPADTTSITYRAWQERYSDSLLSRSILNAARTEGFVWQLDSANAARRNALDTPLVTEVRSHQHEPWRVTAPVLSLYALASITGLGGFIPQPNQCSAPHLYRGDVSLGQLPASSALAIVEEHESVHDAGLIPCECHERADFLEEEKVLVLGPESYLGLPVRLENEHTVPQHHVKPEWWGAE